MGSENPINWEHIFNVVTKQEQWKESMNIEWDAKEYTNQFSFVADYGRGLISLFDRMTELSGEDGLYDWIKMFIKTPFENIPENMVEEMIREAVSDLSDRLFQKDVWHADYVRIRCKAVKNG